MHFEILRPEVLFPPEFFLLTSSGAIMLPRILLVLASGALAAQTDSASSERTKALYVHPLYTLVTSAIDGLPAMIPVTLEVELEGPKSVTVQPELIVGSIASSAKLAGSTAPNIEIKGLSLLCAYRNYLNGKVPTGVYLAPAVGATFAKLHSPEKIDAAKGVRWVGKDASFKGGSVLGYLGARGKWDAISIYTDIGAGYQFASVSGDDIEAWQSNGLALDINIGLGLAF